MSESISSGETKSAGQGEGLTNWSALTSLNLGCAQVAVILGVAVIVIVGIEMLLRLFAVPTYVLPKPSEMVIALWQNFPTLGPHVLVTLRELIFGYLIGASIGIVLAAIITQVPFLEKIVTPYILILVTTPMMALVPLLILKFGFGQAPRVIAVALAVGPMVMINSATGFRRTDAAKLALARVYGASTMQIFTKVRFPLAHAHDHHRPHGRRHLRLDDCGRRRNGRRRLRGSATGSCTTLRWPAPPAFSAS